MIDYLVKLLTDKPIISYLEDPLASSELASWVKLIVIFEFIIEKNQGNWTYQKCKNRGKKWKSLKCFFWDFKGKT